MSNRSVASAFGRGCPTPGRQSSTVSVVVLKQQQPFQEHLQALTQEMQYDIVAVLRVALTMHKNCGANK